jgi:serine/threonine protein kinase
MGAPSPSPDQSGLVTVGQLLAGRYRVESVLGTGGMGKVYKAEHTGIGRTVAIKVLHSRLGGSKEAAQRFQREAIASGRLDHPNIVNVTDSGQLEDGSLYMVMEALEGEPLGNRLVRDKRLPWHEAIAILRGVLAGLQHAHDKGVVHRDIKPDNIFLARKDNDLVIKILDFGIAKLYAGNADDPATTRAGLTVGTPAYLSPEQAVGGAITPATDLYSCSIVLYEMLTGRPPFIDEDPLAMLTAHVSRDAPPLVEIAPDIVVPPGLEDVIQRGLAKVSAERISSATEYIQALDDVSRAAGVEMPMLPRTSGSLPIPSGPHSFTTPAPGFMATPPPMAYATPSPGAIGQPTPYPGHATPVPTHITPMPGDLGHAPTRSLDSGPVRMPQAAHNISLADVANQPLSPRIKLAALAIVAGALVLAVYFIFGHKTEPGKTTVVNVPVPTVDNETRLKAALHDLESGKTCADRKVAIPVLAQIGGDEALAALKKARYRMRGGVLGVGDSNTNACLKNDAEKALQLLGATQR